MPVHRIIGGIEIENDLLRCAPVRLQEQLHQQRLDRRRIVADLVIARRLLPAQLQPVQRRLAGHRRAVRAPRRKLAGQHRHQRIVAQLVMVVEVLVAERDAKDPLTDQRPDLMLDQILPPIVMKASRKAPDQPDRSVGRAQSSAPASDVTTPASNAASTMPAFHPSKIKAFCATLCRHRGAPQITESPCSTATFADSAPRCAYCVRNPG